MIRTFDGSSFKRVGGKPGDRTPSAGFRRIKVRYTAIGGETSIDLSALNPAFNYTPGQDQVTVKRSSGGTLFSDVDFFETSATTIGFPVADPLVAGEMVEVIREFAISGVQVVQPRQDVYTASATAGQTLVTTDFSFPYNMNASKGIGGVEVNLNGIAQTRGVDYTEVNLGGANTNKILFVDALSGGEQIQIIPTYQVLDQTAATSTFQGQQLAAVQAALSSGTQGFVDAQTLITVPNTLISGRAKIQDPSTDLRASLGIDRVLIPGVTLVQGELGPNGEMIYSSPGDDRGLIRMAGSWFTWRDLNAGAGAITGIPGDYVEITFYGTGLNLLSFLSTDNSTRDYRVSVDGGSEGTNILPNSGVNNSAVNASRGYSQNAVYSVVSGLALGTHTVKIRSVGTGNFPIYGFEIINANAAGLITINPGTAYVNGLKNQLLAQTSISPTTGVTGTRGGRSLVYLKADGTIGTSFQAVNSAAAYLTATDHSNEEVTRNISWMEFGAGRADDFSSFAPSNSTRVFTLDDGTTTLNGGSIVSGAFGAQLLPGIGFSVSGATLTLTFVGTGLDVLESSTPTAPTTPFYTVTIDGTVVGNVTQSPNTKWRKIASGLPYGTHTIRFTSGSTAINDLVMARFAVYQPKKPTLPAGAVEIADYNVMATFVPNTVGAPLTMSTGVLRKVWTREVTLVGTFVNGGLDPNHLSGFGMRTATAGDYLEYTFYGTGVDLRFYDGPGGFTFSSTVAIDGSSNLSGYTVSAYGGSGTSITASTGTLVAGGNGTYGAGLIVRGMTLGLHKIRITRNSGQSMVLDTLDIITPVHSTKYSTSSLGNAMVIGSQGIADSRKFTPVKEALPAGKASAQAVGVVSGPTTSTVGLVPVPDMSLTIKTGNGMLDLSMYITVSNATATNLQFAFMVDGQYAGPAAGPGIPANILQTTSMSLQVPVSAGTHKVELYWYTGGGTLMALDTRRCIKAKEV